MKRNLYPYFKFFRRSFIASAMMLMFAVCADAQSNWALPSSRWHFSCGGYYPYSEWECYDISVEKDTIIDAKPCKKLGGYYKDIFTYESGDTAYFYRDSAFRAMYFFNAHVNDTIAIYNDSLNSQLRHQSFIKAVIDSVNIITIQGQQLKQFYARVDSYYYNPYPSWFIYTEKIGLQSDYEDLFYFGYPQVVDGAYRSICNYGDSSFSNYWLYPTSTCATVGISDISLESIKLICYPNPSSGTFTIDMSGLGSGVKTVHIYDQLGRVIYSVETDRSEVTLNLRLAGGMYELEVMADGRSGRGKVVVE